MRILITGRQGSGKTTQARIISQKHNFQLVETGGLVREHSKADTETAKLLRQALESGTLADNMIVSQIMHDAIEGSTDKNIVVDGYPRDLEQLKMYDPHYERVIYLDLSVEEAYNRLLKRGREDDRPEIIKQRLAIFESETMRVVEYYKNSGKLVVIDASPSIEEVATLIERALEL